MGLQPTFEDRKKRNTSETMQKNGIYIKERKMNIIYIFEFSVSRRKVYKHVCFLKSLIRHLKIVFDPLLIFVFLNTYRLSYI